MKSAKLFFALSIFVFLTVSTCFSADNEIILNYNFKQPVVGEVTIDSTVYNTVTISDLPNPNKVGTPLLPVKGAKVYIPDGKKFVSASVEWDNPQEIKLTHLIAPAQKLLPLSQIQDLSSILPDPDLDPDQSIYSTDALYPSVDVKLLSQQGMCGYKIAILNLYPVRYNPVQNTLTYYSTAQLVVTLADVVAKAGTDTISKRADQADLDRVLNFVDNKEDVSIALPVLLKGPELPPLGIEGPFDYVIITNIDLAGTPGPNNLQALRDYRINHNGMTAIVVTVDGLGGIYNHYAAGPDHQPPPSGIVDKQWMIREFIIDAYLRWGTKYVLLAGDADGDYIGGETEEAIIPVRQLYDPDFLGYVDNGLASDLYYACLDGTFDNNANGHYGEYDDGPDGGDVDFAAEVYVGRAPADSGAEISNFVRKTLDYEARKTARDPYLFNTQQAGEALGSIGVREDWQVWKRNLATEDCNEIKQGSGKWSLFTNGFDDRLDNNSTLYDFEYVDSNNIRRCNCWPKADIVNIINNNVHLINGDGHGYVDRLMKMFNPDADSLTNTKYFIGTSLACYSGSFDNRAGMGSAFTRDPDDTDCNCTLNYDSIAEHLVMGAHGAVALVVNSRYGWGVGANTAGPSQFFARSFWGAIFGKQISGLGKANQYSKEEAIPFMDGGYMRWCAFDLNLIGDPALEVFMPTRLVPQDGYSTIPAAIAAALPGETIVVAPGTYEMTKEFDIDINKEIKLKSASGPTATIINCNNYGGCIRFSSVNNASLEGFTIKNGGSGTNSAVVLVGSNATVKNNIFKNCPTAVSTKASSSPNIINNTILGSGVGISLLNSDTGTNNIGGTIKNNILRGLKWAFGTGVFKDTQVSFNGVLDFNNVYLFREGAIAEGDYSFGLNPGPGSIAEEAKFVDENALNYHLDYWISPCIDAGDPNSFYDKEAGPNGYRINMGAYGATFEGEPTFNHRPALNPIGDKSTSVGSNLAFTVSGTDSDNDMLRFSMQNSPVGASLNNTTGVFNWAPACSQAGTYEVTFYAIDQHDFASHPQTITITVGANLAPVLAPIGYHSVIGCQGNIMYFYITATDSENNPLTFSVSNLPDGAGFYQETPNRYRFGWVPRCDQLGSYGVTFTVTDTCGNQDFETVTLVVTDPNAPPPPPPPPCRPCSLYEIKKGICVPCYAQ